MNVLVSGGRNPEDIFQTPVEYVHEICNEIGTLLISNGNIIFAGESTGIDTWVTKAAKDKCLKMGLDYRDRIKVYYHGILPAHENGELIKSRRSDRIVGVPEIVEYSRCGILLSGFTGTQILSQWLKEYSKPIIPIGVSGGTSKILFDEMLSSEKFSEEELKLLQVISSITRTPKEIANAVLDLMGLFTRSQKITIIIHENLTKVGIRPKFDKTLNYHFGIVTALPIERDAVLSRIENVKSHTFNQEDIQTYYTGYIKTNQGVIYNIVVIMTEDQGTVEAALATSRLIYKWDPKYIIMVGIAGGIPKDGLEFGDVVAAREIWEYDYSKITPEGEQRRPHAHRVDALLLDRVNALSNWGRNINEVPLPKGYKRKKAKLFIGIIASGNKIVASEEYRKSLNSLHPKILAVEMETEGVASAAFQIPNPKGTLVIKGIADFSDENKNDEWHEYAANSAAIFLLDFLRSTPIKL